METRLFCDYRDFCEIYVLYRVCACFVYKSLLSLLKSVVQLETLAELVRGLCHVLRLETKDLGLDCGKMLFNLVEELKGITI